MMNPTFKVSKILRDLQEQFGGAIPIDDVKNRGAEEGLDEDQVLEAVEKLENDGMLTWIDDDTVEFD